MKEEPTQDNGLFKLERIIYGIRGIDRTVRLHLCGSGVSRPCAPLTV